MVVINQCGKNKFCFNFDLEQVSKRKYWVLVGVEGHFSALTLGSQRIINI